MRSITRRFRLWILAGACLSLLLLQTAPVSAVLIDFESYPGGAGTTNFDPVNTQFSAWGVSLMDSKDNNNLSASPVIAKHAESPWKSLAYSFPSEGSALAPHPGDDSTYGYAQAPINVYFISPLSYFKIYALDVGYNGLQVNAYDVNSSLIAWFAIDDLSRIHNGTNVTGTGLDLIEFTTPGISMISFAQIRSADWDRANGKGLEGYLLDSMTFTMVPEPSSILLLASGLIGLLGLRRRRL